MRCLLSIDAGGTKCQTIAVKEDGSLLGWGRCGFPDAGECSNFGGSGRSMESVSRAIVEAMQGIDCAELHVISYHWQRAIEDILGDSFSGKIVHHPLHEAGGILELANLSFGVIASAGTGSFVHVVGKDGSRLHLDSLGPLLGDWGSAYHVGLLAVQAAAKCDWHPRHETSLKEAVHRALGIDEAHGSGKSLIGIFDRIKDRAAIADLARLVNQEAVGGDAVANAILEEAAAALAETVFDAYDRLHLKDNGYSLVGTGGLIERSDIFWNHLCDHISKIAPDMKLIRTDLPHVVGTALAVLPEIANGDLDAAKARLINDAKEVFGLKTKELP